MRLLAPLAGLFMFLVPSLTAADSAASPMTPPMTLAEAEALAIARDAARAQLHAAADAEAERAVSAGALPDPDVSIGVANVPLGSFALDADPMTQVMVGVEQMFPPSGSRDALRERGRHLAEAAAILANDRERQVRYALRETWFAAQTAQQLRQLAEDVRAEVATVLNAATGRYASGGGRQADYLAAQLKLDQLEERALRAQQRYLEATAALRRWLGESPAEIVAATLPSPELHANALDRLQAHPLIAAVDARIAAGEAGESAAREAFGPRWKLGFNYGYRRGVEAMTGEPRDDMASIMVGFSLPLFTKNRQDRDLAAARSDTRAARFEREDALRELAGRLDAATQRHAQAVRQLDLYRERLLPNARRVVESLNAAYASSAAGFDELVAAHLERYELEMRRLELEERVQRARAEIRYLAGEPQ